VDRPREPLPTRVEQTPTLPAAYDNAVDAGLRALGLTLTPDVRAAIDAYERALALHPFLGVVRQQIERLRRVEDRRHI